MHFFILILFLMANIFQAHAQEAIAQKAVLKCLPLSDTRNAVADNTLLPPSQIIGLVRKNNPRSEIIQARLCQQNLSWVYTITILHKNGRLIPLVVDGTSGQIKSE